MSRRQNDDDEDDWCDDDDDDDGDDYDDDDYDDDRICSSVVAQWLAHLPLVLEFQGLNPLAARNISLSDHAFTSVIGRDSTE